MILKLYRVYDKIAETGLGPVLIEGHDKAAIRTFTDVCKDKSTQLGQHPHDYELQKIGEIETTTNDIVDNKRHTIITGEQWASLEDKETRTDQMINAHFPPERKNG